ncbi:MAG: glycosyltransferase family 4 protein [Anaerolineae bacterium]|nr:glycosyltransferase family 4 protein [Anaerolineae bacterium]
MHIGFSLLDLAMGGAQTFFVQLAQGLATRGHAISYWLAADANDVQHIYPPLKTALDDVVRPVQHPWDLWKADVIHLDGYHNLWRKLPYLPHWQRCVETYHSTYSVQRAGPLYPPHRVAVSRAVQQQLRLPAHLVYQGIPFHSLPAVADKRFEVAILGRIHPVKNHRLFLRICAELYRQRGACSALLIGGHPKPSPYQQAIDAEIARLRALGVDIHLAGDVPADSLWTRLVQAHILLVTSHTEGFGRMAVEAMAAGLPVIANPVGGLVEIVQHGETGFLVKQDDVESFVTATIHLLDNPGLRRSLAERGRAVVAARFSLESMLEAYESLYRSVITRG